MSRHSHESTHAHDHSHAPGAPAGHHHGPRTSGAAAERPTPRTSLLMQGVALRLLGAAGLAVLLWLAVSWALKDTP